MTDSNTDLLKMARQGNSEAIGTLLNKKLKFKGITAEVSIAADCVQIILRSKEIPDQKTLVSIVKKEILELKIESVKTLRIYGKQINKDSIFWRNHIKLESKQNSSAPVFNGSLLEENIESSKPGKEYYEDFIFSKSSWSPNTTVGKSISSEDFENWKKRNQKVIEDLSQELLGYSDEEVLDIIDVRYKGNSSYLCITNSSFVCFALNHGASPSVKKEFKISIDKVKEIKIANNGLTWLYQNLIYNLYFRRTHPNHIHARLSRITAVEKLETIPYDEYEKRLLTDGIGALAAIVILIILGFSSCIDSLSRKPEPSTQAPSNPSSSATSASQCPCSSGCEYVTDSAWARMSNSERKAFKQAVREIGKCTLVVGDP